MYVVWKPGDQNKGGYCAGMWWAERLVLRWWFITAAAGGEWKSGKDRMGAVTERWGNSQPKSSPGTSGNGMFHFSSFPFSLSWLFTFPLLGTHTVLLDFFNIEDNAGMKIHYSNRQMYNCNRKSGAAHEQKWQHGRAAMLSFALQGRSWLWSSFHLCYASPGHCKEIRGRKSEKYGWNISLVSYRVCFLKPLHSEALVRSFSFILYAYHVPSIGAGNIVIINIKTVPCTTKEQKLLK